MRRVELFQGAPSYAFAVVMVALSALVAARVDAFTHILPGFLFLAAVLLVSWLGNRRAGLIAVILAGVVQQLIFAGRFGNGWTSGDWIHLGIFCLIGTLASLLVSRGREHRIDFCRTLERLERSEAWLAPLVSEVKDFAIFSTDPAGAVSTWNEGCRNVLGYAEQEFIGMDSRQLFTPEDAATGVPEEELKTAKKTGSASDDRWMMRKGGERFWAEGITSSVHNALGELVAYTKILRDNTRHRQADEALRISEARKSAILDHAIDAVVTTDQAARVMEWNPTAQRIFGHAPGDAIGRELADLIIPAPERPRFREELQRFLIDGCSPAPGLMLEISALHSGGALIPIELSLSAVDVEGQRGLTAFARDLSGRKKFEEELRRSEERYCAFVQQSAEGIWRFEIADGLSTGLPEEEQMLRMMNHAVLAECNDAMARMYGYERAEELIGACVRDLLAEDPRSRELLRSFIRSGYRLTDAESLERDKEQQEKWFWNNILGVVENGRLVRVWGTQRDITHLKHVEAARSESEERLRLALEGGKLSIWEMDLATEVGKIDGRSAELFGLPPGTREICGTEFRRRVHPSDREAVQKAIKSSLQGLSDYAIEFRVIRPDQSTRWIAAKGDVVRDAAGHPIRMVGVNFDVTARKEAEENFRIMADNMPQLAWMADGRGELFWFNQQWLEYTGTTAEQMTCIGWRSTLPPEQQENAEARVRAHFQKGEAWEETFLMRDRTGGYRYFLTRAAPAREENGRIWRWFGTCTDITEQRNAAAVLEQSIERQRLLSDTARELLVTEDPLELLERVFHSWAAQLELDFFFHFIVERGEKCLRLRAAKGISEQQAKSVSRLDFGEAICGRAAVELVPQRLSDVQSSRDPRTEFIRELGVTAYVCHPLLAHGRFLGTLSFGTHRRPSFSDETIDFTGILANMVATAISRKQAELSLQEARRALEGHNLELEHRVAERTASLNASLRSVEELLYTIAHDLRAPNRAMSGFASIIEHDYSEQFDSRGRDYLRRIRQGALRNDRLIADLLRYGRLSHAELPLEPIPLETAVNEALQTFHGELESRGCQVVLGPLTGVVLANSSALDQILTNLIGNAVKYAAATQGRIEISTERSAKGYILRVKDNGIGIPPELHDQIFQPFIRLKSPLDGTGTGIGLAIVRKAVERLKGKVGVESVPGEGSSFWIELPAASLGPASG